MFCKYCGKEVEDTVVVCPHCGKQISELKVEQQSDSENGQINVLSLVGFILSFFISIAGLICCIIGYKQIKENGENGKGFAIAGIAISAASMALATLSIGMFSCVLCSVPMYYL